MGWPHCCRRTCVTAWFKRWKRAVQPARRHDALLCASLLRSNWSGGTPVSADAVKSKLLMMTVAPSRSSALLWAMVAAAMIQLPTWIAGLIGR